MAQVKGPDHPGPKCVIADCPDESYLPSLLQAPIWQRLFHGQGTPAENHVDVVCHLAAAEVTDCLLVDPLTSLLHPNERGFGLQIVERRDYQDWLAGFGPETHHIYVNAAATGAAPIMASSAVLQARLNCVHPGIFPLHQSCGSAPEESSQRLLPWIGDRSRSVAVFENQSRLQSSI